MNDRVIISSISKIYFSILSFFIFIFLALSVTFLLLSKGINLKEITLSSFHINRLYIKWDEKLNVSIDKLTIFTNKNASSNNFKTKDIRKYLKKIGFIGSFIESLIIEDINYRDIKATFRYVEKDGGYARASSSNFNINTIIYKTKKHINFEIIDFEDSVKKIHANGNIVLDLIDRELLLNISSNIGSEISLNIFTYIDAHQLKYAVSSNKNINNIDHLISILHLNPTMKYWIYDAIKMKSIALKKAYGYIDFKNSDEAFKNLYISADVEKMEYKYNLALDSIHTQTTNLEFTNGVLNIKPTNHTTYDFFLDKSWLKIDFSKKEYELVLYLLLEGSVDKNLIYLLKTYGIKLPFIQNKGTLSTNLTLSINLMTLDVDAQGTFDTDNSNFTYLGLDLDIFKAHVTIDNSNVSIDKMFAKYKNSVASNVNAKLDLKHNIGQVNFKVKKADFVGGALSLDENKTIDITYNVNDGNDNIKVSNSYWKLYSKEKMFIENIMIPFNYENLFANIPTTQIKIEDIATVYISGSTSFKTLSTNLEFDLAKFNYQNVSLNQSNLLFNLSFSESKLSLKSNDYANFIINNTDVSFFKPSILFNKDIFVANSSELKIENILQSDISFNYSTKFSNGYLNLKNIDFKNNTLGDIFKYNENIGFKIENNDNIINAQSIDLGILISTQEDKWIVSLNSLERLYKYSPLLQKYNLDNGEISIFKDTDKDNIHFTADINHKNKFLSINNTLIDNYIINGYIDNENNDINLLINDKINVKISDDITIKGKDVGVNLATTLAFIKEVKDPASTTKAKDVSLELRDSYIFFTKDRRAIADKINLQYYNEIVTAQLMHNGAEAGFKLEDEIFYLYGEGFNDKFMGNLFALSKFKNGEFDFSMKGRLDEFAGILYIKNTTIIKYKLLNNILAFVNTIPALVTFSLPGYDKNGLKVQSSYINFTYKDDIFKLKDIYLDSKEMKIAGKGTASYDKNTIDLKLNLKTDLGSTMSKIPIVGYIIFDKDSISTSLKVSGPLDDPKVESMIASDIIVAPLNIIKRTLLFPFKIFESDD